MKESAGKSVGIGFRLFAIWFLPVSLAGLFGYISTSFVLGSSIIVGLLGTIGVFVTEVVYSTGIYKFFA